jgi:hypothetical protein
MGLNAIGSFDTEHNDTEHMTLSLKAIHFSSLSGRGSEPGIFLFVFSRITAEQEWLPLNAILIINETDHVV